MHPLYITVYQVLLLFKMLEFIHCQGVHPLYITVYQVLLLFKMLIFFCCLIK